MSDRLKDKIFNGWLRSQYPKEYSEYLKRASDRDNYRVRNLEYYDHMFSRIVDIPIEILHRFQRRLKHLRVRGYVPYKRIVRKNK